MNHADKIAIISAKIHALLAQTHGAAGESFRTLTDDAQDMFMLTVSDLAGEAARLAREAACAR